MDNKDTQPKPYPLLQLPYPTQQPYPPQQPYLPEHPAPAYSSYPPSQQQQVTVVVVPQSVPSNSGDAGVASCEGVDGFAFSDKSIRRGFIRKVYLILCSQLAFTFGCVLVVSLVPALRDIARANAWLFHVGYVVFIVVYIVLVCSTAARRKFPGNFVALVIFTVALTFATAVISARFQTNAVLICLGITVLVCIGVTLFAVQTRIDFTLCYGLLFGLSLVVLLFGLACFFSFLAFRGQGDFLVARILDCVYGGLVALVLVLFLIYDTQRVIGGRRHNLSEEEYVFGALQLYMDVVFIFIVMLGFSGVDR